MHNGLPCASTTWWEIIRTIIIIIQIRVAKISTKNYNILICKWVFNVSHSVGRLMGVSRYNDMTKGACGCGSEPNPPDFWTKSKFTAAGNAMMVAFNLMISRIKLLLFSGGNFDNMLVHFKCHYEWYPDEMQPYGWCPFGPSTHLHGRSPDGPRWTLELVVPLKLWTLLPAMQASSHDDDDDSCDCSMMMTMMTIWDCSMMVMIMS